MAARTVLAAAIAASILAAPLGVLAQTTGFSLNRFEPSDRGSDWFANESLDLRGNMRPALGAIVDWAYRPLVLEDATSPSAPQVEVILDQVFVHVGGSFVFRDRFRVAADQPFAVFQQGEDVAGRTIAARAPDGPALGDTRLSGDVRVLGKYGANFSAALGAQLHLPTGSQEQFTGDGTVRVTPRLLVAGNVEGFAYAAKLGFAYRPLDATFEGRELGSEAVFSVAAGVEANDRFVFGPELYGSTVVTGGDRPFSTRNTPLEMLVGAHVTLASHWQVGMAVGPGFTRGDGTPVMRALFSLEFAPDPCVDKDGDGICEPYDACPEIAGLPTIYRRTNGCPSDRDFDGFPDKVDACPTRRGQKTADPKTAGCPDSDKDGVADNADACVSVPGMPTEDAKTNGCPVAEEPEAKLVIREQISFPAGSSGLDRRAVAALNEVLKVMRDNPEIVVRVEGHTDDREQQTVTELKTLSQKRADAARKWLEDHGIDAARLRSEGYGADRLVDTTGTADSRRKNRRVEFHAIEEPKGATAK